MRLQCFGCQKFISTELPETTLFRGVAQCPECIALEDTCAADCDCFDCERAKERAIRIGKPLPTYEELLDAMHQIAQKAMTLSDIVTLARKLDVVEATKPNPIKGLQPEGSTDETDDNPGHAQGMPTHSVVDG